MSHTALCYTKWTFFWGKMFYLSHEATWRSVMFFVLFIFTIPESKCLSSHRMPLQIEMVKPWIRYICLHHFFFFYQDYGRIIPYCYCQPRVLGGVGVGTPILEYCRELPFDLPVFLTFSDSIWSSFHGSTQSNWLPFSVENNKFVC